MRMTIVEYATLCNIDIGEVRRAIKSNMLHHFTEDRVTYILYDDLAIAYKDLVERYRLNDTVVVPIYKKLTGKRMAIINNISIYARRIGRDYIYVCRIPNNDQVIFQTLEKAVAYAQSHTEYSIRSQDSMTVGSAIFSLSEKDATVILRYLPRNSITNRIIRRIHKHFNLSQ